MMYVKIILVNVLIVAFSLGVGEEGKTAVEAIKPSEKTKKRYTFLFCEKNSDSFKTTFQELMKQIDERRQRPPRSLQQHRGPKVHHFQYSLFTQSLHNYSL
jgi:hypothetical protein